MSFEFVHSTLFSCSTSPFWPWLVGLLANTTALLVIVLLGGLVVGRRRAPLRGLIGGIGLVSLTLVPLASLLLAWQRGMVGPPVAPAAGSGGVFSWSSVDWTWLTLGVWAAGALGILARFAVDRVALGFHVRSLEPHARWSRNAAGLAGSLGIRRPVRVLQSKVFEIPCTWGLLKPVILLPRAATSWSPDRMRAVLLHELGHIRRWDGLLSSLSRVGCALFWFHPLVWWIQGQVREDAERACDRLVIEDGMAPESYARHLLGIVREARTGAPRLAHGMAAESMLSRRIASLLDPRSPGSRIGWTAALATLTVLILGTLLVTEVSSPRLREDGGLVVGLDCTEGPAPLESQPYEDLQSHPTDPYPLHE